MRELWPSLDPPAQSEPAPDPSAVLAAAHAEAERVLERARGEAAAVVEQAARRIRRARAHAARYAARTRRMALRERQAVIEDLEADIAACVRAAVRVLGAGEPAEDAVRDTVRRILAEADRSAELRAAPDISEAAGAAADPGITPGGLVAEREDGASWRWTAETRRRQVETALTELGGGGPA